MIGLDLVRYKHLINILIVYFHDEYSFRKNIVSAPTEVDLINLPSTTLDFAVSNNNDNSKVAKLEGM